MSTAAITSAQTTAQQDLRSAISVKILDVIAKCSEIFREIVSDKLSFKNSSEDSINLGPFLGKYEAKIGSATTVDEYFKARTDSELKEMIANGISHELKNPTDLKAPLIFCAAIKKLFEKLGDQGLRDLFQKG